MGWVGLSRLRVGLLAGCLAATVAGCGSTASNNAAVTVQGNALTIYAAQPPGAQTPVDADVLDAEHLALTQAGSRVGRFTLHLRVIHDDTVSANAREAISDKTAIAYLGEIQPGTSGVSTQITNQLGLLQISPTDNAIYLTQATSAVPGSPTHWYPSHNNFGLTFARVVPSSAKEATAIVERMHAQHASSLYVGSDSSSYGRSIALEVLRAARTAGLHTVATAAGADAIFYAGQPDAAAARAVDAAAGASGQATVFLPSAFYDPRWVAGLPAAVQHRLVVSAPGFLPGHYAGTGAQFASAFRSAYGHAPQPQAVFGYVAMKALLAALQQAGAKANSRSQVIDDVQGLHDQQSAVGTFSLNGGDTNVAPFVFARPAAGTLVPRAAG